MASRASRPSGSTPAFCGSRPVLTWTKSVGQAPLRLHRAGELLGEAGAVEAVDGVEQGERAIDLVGLQRTDEVQADVGVVGDQRAPAGLGLLHAVLAEDPLAGVEHRTHPVGRLHLGDGDEGHRPGRAAGAGGGGCDAGLDVLERHGRDHSGGRRVREGEAGPPSRQGQNSMEMPKSASVALSSSVAEIE